MHVVFVTDEVQFASAEFRVRLSTVNSRVLVSLSDDTEVIIDAPPLNVDSWTLFLFSSSNVIKMAVLLSQIVLCCLIARRYHLQCNLTASDLSGVRER